MGKGQRLWEDLGSERQGGSKLGPMHLVSHSSTLREIRQEAQLQEEKAAGIKTGKGGEILVLPCNQLLIGWRTWLAEMGTGPSRPNKSLFLKNHEKLQGCFIKTALTSSRSTIIKY